MKQIYLNQFLPKCVLIEGCVSSRRPKFLGKCAHLHSLLRGFGVKLLLGRLKIVRLKVSPLYSLKSMQMSQHILFRMPGCELMTGSCLDICFYLKCLSKFNTQRQVQFLLRICASLFCSGRRTYNLSGTSSLSFLERIFTPKLVLHFGLGPKVPEKLG